VGEQINPTPAWRRYLRFWGHDSARDLDDELRFHLAARYDECVAAGMTPADARAEVERRFGDVARVREECVSIDSQWTRERSMIEALQRVGTDLRYAVRQLRRNASLSVAAILCLALGIGANTSIFSVVSAVLFRPLSFHEPDRLVLVGEGLPAFSDQNFGVISTPEFADYRRLDGSTFTGSAIYDAATLSIAGGSDDPARVTALRVSSNLLDVLGVPVARGRGFTAADADTAEASVVIVSDALWRRRFNADPHAVGRVVDVEGRPTTVIGVLPPSFQFPLPGAGGQPADLFVPIKFTAAMESMRGNAYYTWLVARMAPGVTLESARHAVSNIAANLPRLHPDSYGHDWKIVADAYPLRDHAVKDVRGPLLILLGAVGVVLLIACINVSSLLLARAAAREREIAVRQAVGASFGQLVRQFLAESAVLVVAGGTLGVVVAVWVARFLAAHAPSEVLQGYAVSIDMRVLGVTGAIAIVTTVLFSLVPAFGRGKGGLAPSLYDSSRGSTAGVARQRGRRALVVTQISLALLLSTAAGLMIRSFARARDVDPGFEPRHLVTFRTGLPAARYPTAVSILQFENRLIDALGRIPGVHAVSATNNLPFGAPSRIAFAVEGTAFPKIPLASNEIVYPAYLDAMGIRAREGRGFSSSDVSGTLPVVLVNQTLARRYFPDRPAIGKRIKWGSPQSPSPWLTIVGVTADVTQRGVDQPSDPEIYFPAAQVDSTAVLSFLRGPAFVVRGDGDVNMLMSAVQRVVRSTDANLPIVGLQKMTDLLDTSMSGRYFNTVLLAGFALLALVLASVGVYGLITHTVVQRTREIGVRLAIGARPVEIVRLVLGQGVVLASIGVTIGLVGAVALTRVMRTLLFDVSPFDIPTFASAAVLLLVVAIIAGYLPARRASRIDPLAALRSD
jgi:putative ABC transport system permease protein